MKSTRQSLLRLLLRSAPSRLRESFQKLFLLDPPYLFIQKKKLPVRLRETESLRSKPSDSAVAEARAQNSVNSVVVWREATSIAVVPRGLSLLPPVSGVFCLPLGAKQILEKHPPESCLGRSSLP